MTQPSKPKARGFSRASTLLQSRIRRASEGRGFAAPRLLTHWAEIVGEDIAKCARPVQVSYTKGGMGATLSLLTTGAMAPMLEMQKQQICDKVNACYGYRAIARIRITQTAPTGFADGRVAFEHAPAQPTAGPAPEQTRAAAAMARDVSDDALRDALSSLGSKILSKHS